MSTKKNFKVIILWEDEVREAGIKINELIDMNVRLSEKDNPTKEEREEYGHLQLLAMQLCYSALNGIDEDCAITISRKPGQAKDVV